jgi:hypothetical protein
MTSACRKSPNSTTYRGVGTTNADYELNGSDQHLTLPRSLHARETATKVSNRPEAVSPDLHPFLSGHFSPGTCSQDLLGKQRSKFTAL